MEITLRHQVPLLVVAVVLAGCNRNAYLAQMPTWQQSQESQVAQVQELQRRLSELDANNSDLHTQLAQSRQASQVYQDQVSLLQKQLRETANQLQDAQLARKQLEEKLDNVVASTQQRGGAMITANTSLKRSLQSVQLSGLEIREDKDLLRIEIPADELFATGSAQLHSSAAVVLERVARAIAEHYPRQMIGIEAHSDNSPVVGGTAGSLHQLTSMQSVAVFEHLTRQHRLPAKQFFTLGMGPNNPRLSNATPAGRAKNRRVEVVIYPETFDR